MQKILIWYEMKDFSYLLNREIENMDEVKERLEFTCFERIDTGKDEHNELIILHEASIFFNENITNKIPHQKIMDPENSYVYGFLLVTPKSILENREYQLNKHLYPPYFENCFRHLDGCSIIGYGIDERILDMIRVGSMIYSLWCELTAIYGRNCFHYRVDCDYIWFDCPLEKRDVFIDHRHVLEKLEYNPNLLYKFVR